MKSNRRGQVIKIDIDKNEIPRDSSRPLIIHSRFFVYETCVKKRKEKKKKKSLIKTEHTGSGHTFQASRAFLEWFSVVLAGYGLWFNPIRFTISFSRPLLHHPRLRNEANHGVSSKFDELTVTTPWLLDGRILSVCVQRSTHARSRSLTFSAWNIRGREEGFSLDDMRW